MRISLTRALLEHLAESGMLLLDGLFPKQYAMTWPSRRLLGLDRGHYPSPRKARKSILTILSRLQKEGLVSQKASQKWTITSRGKLYLTSHRPRAHGVYKRVRIVAPADGVVRLVTFDVPERERPKRKWLRRELLACGYERLHKSVFIGTRPLPEEFVKEVDKHGLDDYLHIVRIEAAGTLPKQRKNNISLVTH